MLANEMQKKENPLCPIHGKPMTLTTIDGDEQFVCRECQTDELVKPKEDKVVLPTLDGWIAD